MGGDSVKYGITDLPLREEDDRLDILPYVNGLAAYISHCNTPISIAIQGGWGTGKTSLINLINKQLSGGNILTFTFDTWQYSQFHMENELVLSFLKFLTGSLGRFDHEILSKFNDLVKKTSSMVLLQTIKNTTSLDFSALADKKMDLAEEITALKKEFTKAVSTLLDKRKLDKLVIFIDDLDRLNPGIAVQLLEVIKLFLDVKGCVFVLAIDYDVVIQGVRQKYGKDLPMEKCKDFFDKIIQLPFRMPVGIYNIKNYLLHIGNLNVSPDSLDKLVAIVRASIGGNPRAIKRLLNYYQLIQIIMESKGYTLEEEERCLLIAVLCMQQSYEPLHAYLQDTSEWTSLVDESGSLAQEKHIFNILLDSVQYAQIAEQLLGRYREEQAKPEYFLQMKEFIASVFKLFDGNGELPGNESLDKLSSIMEHTTVLATTASGAHDYVPITQPVKGKKALGIRWESRTGTVENTQSFTAAVVWVLDTLCAQFPDIKSKLEHIVPHLEEPELSGLQRFFNEMLPVKRDMKYPPSSVKQLNNANVRFTAHYSSEDLRKILVSLFRYLEVNPDEYFVICNSR